MIPTFENLIAYRNKGIVIAFDVPNNSAPFSPIAPGRTVVGASSVSVVLTASANGLSLTLAPPGTATDAGLWVKYVPGKATYGEVTGAKNWGASGPFTGCRIEAGFNNGNKYLAHIAKEAGADTRTPWMDEHVLGATFGNANVLLRGKVEPSEKCQDAVVFVVWEGDKLRATKVSRKGVDGGYIINKVEKIKNEVRQYVPS